MSVGGLPGYDEWKTRSDLDGVGTECMCCGELRMSDAEGYCQRCRDVNDGQCPDCGDPIQDDHTTGVSRCFNCGYSPEEEIADIQQPGNSDHKE